MCKRHGCVCGEKHLLNQRSYSLTHLGEQWILEHGSENHHSYLMLEFRKLSDVMASLAY